MKTFLTYIAHNGSTHLLEEEIDYTPNLASTLCNESLKDNSCTGFFVIIEVNYTVNGKTTKCEVVALETNRDIYEQWLNGFIEELTT